MPLKHATETLLVIVLGIAVAATGILISTLPALPEGGLPFAILLLAAIAYPLSLMRVFKNNRADYAFRWMHWYPALMLAVWISIEMLIKVSPSLEYLRDLNRWGWALSLVSIGFIGLVIFCIRVIRRRVPRIILLLAVFVPLAVSAYMSEGGKEWDKYLAGTLWGGEWLNKISLGLTGTGTGIQIAMEEKEPKNLGESADAQEEAWRERIRAFERRREMIASEANNANTGAQIPAEIAEVIEPAPYTGTGREFREADTSPTSLPSAGVGLSGAGLMLSAAYCGLLHQRARRNA